MGQHPARRGDAVEAVRSMKRTGPSGLRTLGSLTLCRSLLKAGLVDRFRVVVFPVITGAPGASGSTTAIPTWRWTWWTAGRSTEAPAARVPPAVLTGPPGGARAV